MYSTIACIVALILLAGCKLIWIKFLFKLVNKQVDQYKTIIITDRKCRWYINQGCIPYLLFYTMYEGLEGNHFQKCARYVRISYGFFYNLTTRVLQT